MRNDLLAPQAAINWAVAQIPILVQRIETYGRERPYEIIMEKDAKTQDVLMVFRSLGPPDLILSVETGLIINALRSSLDLLCAALARRNRVKPNSKMHFPIRKWRKDFRVVAKNIKKEKWLSNSELAKIKSLKPYKRGNLPLYALSFLDNTRKHEQLLEITPVPGNVHTPMFIPGTKGEWRNLKDKTVMLRLPPGTDFVPTESNTHVAIQVTFTEPTVGLAHQPVIPILLDLVARVSSIINLFDVP